MKIFKIYLLIFISVCFCTLKPMQPIYSRLTPESQSFIQEIEKVECLSDVNDPITGVFLDFLNKVQGFYINKQSELINLEKSQEVELLPFEEFLTYLKANPIWRKPVGYCYENWDDLNCFKYTIFSKFFRTKEKISSLFNRGWGFISREIMEELGDYSLDIYKCSLADGFSIKFFVPQEKSTGEVFRFARRVAIMREIDKNLFHLPKEHQIHHFRKRIMI